MTDKKIKIEKREKNKKHDFEEKQIEITIKLWLPEHQSDFDLMMEGHNAFSALWNIHNLCRQVWKHEENPSEDRVKLAEEIADMIGETRLFEIYT